MNLFAGQLLVFHPEKPTYSDIFANIIDQDAMSYMVCSQDYKSTNYKLANPMCSLFILAEPVRVRMDFARTEAARWKDFESRTKRFVSCVALIEKTKSFRMPEIIDDAR